MKGISFFTYEPGHVLNLFWLLTLVLSAWSSSYASYQIGLNRLMAFILGVLYAFLPFALLRNVAHLNLVYYIVPLLCLLAVVILNRGGGVRNTRQAIIVGLLACVLQGFNYIYYSFFAVLIFFISAIFAWDKSKGIKQLRLPLASIILILLSTAINLTPWLISKSVHGSPPEMAYKNTAEAEIYGAKIRKMLAPHPNNLIKPLAKYASKDIQSNFPNENENVTVRLGFFGAAGLLLSILFVLRRRAHASSDDVILSVSSLCVVTLLFIVVGGFGAVINLITVPDIRAYNRFSVFLSFFAMTVFGLWIHSLGNKCDKLRGGIVLSALLFFALFSLYDQLLDRHGLVAQQQGDTKRAHDERKTVEVLEQALPNGAAVLQLPFTGFPPLANFNDMWSYDHARAYLWSRHLKWSWPSFSQRHRAWQTTMAEKRGGDFLNFAILSGFQAIWIDRAAYKDGGAELISSLSQGAVVRIPLPSDRFVVLDLRQEANVLKSTMPPSKFNQLSSEVLESTIVFE